ncbi:MAG: pyruvate dehydrogenase [Candidatus Rokubacteria bacterium]|nr:pyruvate dehydrogenase [Candidatus Rokubacteria bacterium]
MIATEDVPILRSIERKLLWLSTWMVHHANFVRPSADGTKVGGHQASSSSVVTLVTALYFHWLRPGDVVATKAHGSPAFYAAQCLRGRLPAGALRELRTFGGLQAYPSRRKNPEIVDLSTGSMGLGAVQATFGALAARYLADHGGRAFPERFVVMVGDAELDEGNVWEALLEETVAELGHVLWIVDVNRQSLDRVVPDVRRAQLPAMFRAAGWRVIELRWGTRLRERFGRRGGAALRRRLEAMPGGEYHRLLRLPPSAVRKALVTTHGDVDPAIDRVLADVADDDLPALLADVGGHDLVAIDAALAEATREASGPAVIFADTIKGFGTPLAADPLNHTTLLSTAQVETLRDALGARSGDEWAGFAESSAEARYIARLPALFQAPPASDRIEIPMTIGEAYPPESSTQEAFGRVLGALARTPAADRIVTVSADVAVTTHLAGWINRKGVYFPRAKPSHALDTPQAVAWKESPAGQHIELGIAEHNLFLVLGALGLAREVSGQTLIPIGTLYDPFVPRGLDALYHALYSGARFVVAATPSGVSLSPEGGAHQSVITPGIGIAVPAITYAEPAFALEVEWLLLDALARIAGGSGESLYLRLSTRPIDQRLAPAPSDAYRDAVLQGGYRLVDARTHPDRDAEADAVHLFVTGVLAPEAVDASRRLAAEGIFASVFVVTSADRLYRDLRMPRPRLLSLIGADEEDVPVVSALDGHSHALAFLGGALGVPQWALGVDDFGQSGARGDLYRHYGIDAGAIVRAARTLAGRP